MSCWDDPCICNVSVCKCLLPSCVTATIHVTPKSSRATPPLTKPPSPTWKMTITTPTTPASTTSASHLRPRRSSVARPPLQPLQQRPTNLRPTLMSWTDSMPRSTSPDPRLLYRTSIRHRQTGERGEGGVSSL